MSPVICFFRRLLCLMPMADHWRLDIDGRSDISLVFLFAYFTCYTIIFQNFSPDALRSSGSRDAIQKSNESLPYRYIKIPILDLALQVFCIPYQMRTFFNYKYAQEISSSTFLYPHPPTYTWHPLPPSSSSFSPIVSSPPQTFLSPPLNRSPLNRRGDVYQVILQNSHP